MFKNLFKRKPKPVTPKREGCTLSGPCDPAIVPGLGGIECQRCGYVDQFIES